MGVEKAWKSINSAYAEWSEHLGNPNFCRQGSELTWQARELIWLENEFDSSAYLKLAEARQYSFVVVEDGGLIQLHYEFKEGLLLRASAGYYGSSQISIIERETTLNEALEESELAPEFSDIDTGLNHQGSGSLDSEEPPTVLPEDGPSVPQRAEIVEIIPSIRFDYSPEHRRPFVHEHAHLHIPSFAQTRIAVSGFPSPQQFVEMVFAWFYPEIYEKKYQDYVIGLNPSAKSIDNDHVEAEYVRSRVARMRESILQIQSASLSHLPMVKF